MSKRKYCEVGGKLNLEHSKAVNDAILARAESDRHLEAGGSLSSEQEQRLRSAEAGANEAAKVWDEHFWHCPICNDPR